MSNNFIEGLLIIIVSLTSLTVLVVESATNDARYAHSSAIVNDKLYIFGGRTDSTQESDDMFYLDLTQTFNIRALSWRELTGMRLSYASATTLKDRIFLFGGMNFSEDP